MKNAMLYARDDVVRSKLGTLLIIYHVTGMEDAVKYSKGITFCKYYAQRLEVRHNKKFGGDFGPDFLESPGDNALVFTHDDVTIYDDFSGNFTYEGTLDEFKAANNITSTGAIENAR